MTGRPPRAEATGVKPYIVTGYGDRHTHEIADGGWVYPCTGCGCELWTPAHREPCPTPYRKPDDIPTMTALLTEIRDEARKQTAILQAWAADRGVDVDRGRCWWNTVVPTPDRPGMFTAGSKCTLQRGHMGPCE